MAIPNTSAPTIIQKISANGICSLYFIQLPGFGSLFNKVLAVDPNNAYALALKGISLASQHRYAEAISLFDNTLAVDPSDVKTLI